MSEEDSELERLKAKRLAEMQKNISTKQETKSDSEPQKETVLENAESQFPNESKMIVEKLSELIKTGEIDESLESLDGGKLLALFRSVGLNVRMATKINVEQYGKFVSLSDKLSNQTSGDE